MKRLPLLNWDEVNFEIVDTLLTSPSIHPKKKTPKAQPVVYSGPASAEVYIYFRKIIQIQHSNPWVG